MSVKPGFGGQSFITEALTKLRLARARIDAVHARTGREIRLEVDGGVKVDNIGAIAKAGADTFVAGSAIFGTSDYAATIAAMRTAAAVLRRIWRAAAVQTGSRDALEPADELIETDSTSLTK